MMPPKEQSPGTKRPRPPGDLSSVRGGVALERNEFVSLTRDYLALLRQSLVDQREAGGSGRAFVRDYSRMVDTVVGLLFQRSVVEHGLTTRKTAIAIMGMGGYGRAELAPYSDVDILVLCRRKTPVNRQVAASFVRLMWDVGFELGHAVESIVESESTLARHMDMRTALYESRWICGSAPLARQAERQIRRLRRQDRERFLVRKVRDAVVRHKKYSNHYQLIEPDVKMSPGGMRDYQTLVWLGMVLQGKLGLSALARKGLLLSGETRALEAAYDFLLRVRVELHLATASRQDQLTVAMQQNIARPMGYSSKGGHLGVELFMRDYYHHTRTVFQITDDIIEELQRGRDLSILLGGRRKNRKAPSGIRRINRKRIREDPLYLFARQKVTGEKFDRGLKRRLEAILDQELSGRREKERMRRAFPALVRNGRNLTLVLRSMHETGFLGAVIPEYNELTSLKRYDLYHHYTVDEHSFQVVNHVENLARRSRRPDPLARLYSEIADKHVLFFAALLHDIGKIEGRGHARKGAALAKRILARMGVAQTDIGRISYLIEIHLLMSHFSQRRDPTDIGALQSFASKVRSRGNLKCLCLLTYADLRATSPIVWTEWKRSLLWALYLKAYEFMASKEKEPDTVYKSRKSALLRAFPAGRARRRGLEHLDMLPGRYLLAMRAAQVKRHLELIDALSGHRFAVGFKRRRAATEVTVCTLDKPFRLSQLCGVLTLNDCNILFAYAFTRTDGRVIDVFHVEELGDSTAADGERERKIRHDLEQVLSGRLDIQSAVERHVARWKRKRNTSIPVPARVEFDNDTSAEVTIIDVFAMDRPGILFTITRALSEEGLTIHRARISTEANRVIDSFDVQGRDGKVTAARKLRRIRRRLEGALA